MSRNDLGIPAYTLRLAQSASSGSAKYRVLVYGANEGECNLPAAANAASLAGVTLDSASAGEGVALQQYGHAQIEAAGAISLGSLVNVADATGRIKAVNEAAGTKVNLVGVAEEAATAAGDVIKVDIRNFGSIYTA